MKRKWKSNLSLDEKKAVAQNIMDGGHVKQIAAKWQISPAYAYQIVNELMIWKLEWKMKE